MHYSPNDRVGLPKGSSPYKVLGDGMHSPCKKSSMDGCGLPGAICITLQRMDLVSLMLYALLSKGWMWFFKCYIHHSSRYGLGLSKGSSLYKVLEDGMCSLQGQSPRDCSTVSLRIIMSTISLEIILSTITNTPII